jgi:tetratricopeptide (TPR) repeat protein
LLAAQVGLGKIDEAYRTVERFEVVAPGSPFSTRFRMWLAMHQRDAAQADSLSMVLKRRPEPTWQMWGNIAQADFHENHGRIRRGRESVLALIDLAEQQQNLGAYLERVAWLAWLDVHYLADTASALTAVEDALEQYPLDDLPPTSRPYRHLAEFYVEAGEVERAKTLVAAYEATVPEGYREGEGGRHRTNGDIAMAEGRYREAVDHYRAGVASGTCLTCSPHAVGLAFDRLGESDSAIAIFEAALDTLSLLRTLREVQWLGPTYKRLGELYEGQDRQKALDYYSRFVDLWRDADPELQPVVEEVRQRMADLSGEPN